jgi:hypothetical protein
VKPLSGDDAPVTREEEGKALYRLLRTSEKKVKVGLTEGQKRALKETREPTPQPG